MAVHFLPEKFHFVLNSSWWVFDYLIFHHINVSKHGVTNFIDFDWFRQPFRPLFDLKLLFLKML